MVEVKAYSGLIRNCSSLAGELGVDIGGGGAGDADGAGDAGNGGRNDVASADGDAGSAGNDSLSRREREEKVLLAAYEAWGDQMGLHINGQFALALYDSATEELFCTRDILGAELLFYYETSEGRLLVGTQISDLFNQPGFVRELNEEMIQLYLGLTYVPGEETLFAGVHKLEPGGFLRFGREGLRLGRYWELTFSTDETKTLDEWASDISDAMDASMRDICDVNEQPASFLSGGVDSSYMLAKSRAATGYCATYADQQASEEAEARATAEYLGRNFENIEVTPEDFFATLDEFLLAYEQPTSDAAGLSLYCACKKVAGRESLCFSGEGADEFFAGYNGYQDTSRFDKKSDPVYWGATKSMRELDQKHYLKRYFPERRVSEFMRRRGEGARAYDTVTWMLYVDLRTYFEGSILFNSTKISRGTGLDIRMPYCDLRIFDISLRMPSRFKVSPEGNKLALRRAASRVLPQDVAYRKKLGFPVPIKDWLADPAYNADIHRAFSSEAAKRFFKVKELSAMLSMFEGGKTNLWHRLRYRGNTAPLWRRIWSIYVFIRWYELFFEGE